MTHSRFIIRWDDISRFQDRKKYRALIDLFLRYDKPAVLGVVPDVQDPAIRFDDFDENEFLSELKDLEQKGWEIAQHGYRHIAHTDDGGLLGLNNASEFAGRPFADQIEDLKKGKEILNSQGFKPVTFVPPWHAFDDNTLRALRETGFRIISDGRFLYPRDTDGLLQLPMIFWSVPNYLRALSLLGGVYTICLHPHLIKDADLNQLEEFFQKSNPCVITPSSLLDNPRILNKSRVKRMVAEKLFASFYSGRAGS